jgi:alpha-amylase
MACRAMVQSGQNQADLRVEKDVIPEDETSCLTVHYMFSNKGDAPVDTIFACEWNFNLLGGGHNESAYYRVDGADIGDVHLDSSGEILQAEHLIMGNKYLGIEIELKLERPLTLWRFPVESLSNSEGGIERVYQANCLVILLPLQLDRNGEFSLRYSWHVKEIKP